MKNLVIIFSLFLATASTASAEGKITFIHFSFTNPDRLIYNEISVYITLDSTGTTTIHTICNPKSGVEDVDHNKLDTLFSDNFEPFLGLVINIQQLDTTAVMNNQSYESLERNTCKVSYGNSNKTITYRVWSPDYNTAERKLGSFFKLCSRILEVGGLRPKDVF